MRIATSFVAALAAYVSIAATAEAQTVNLPPTISGSPATSLYTYTTYDFRPTARDPEGRNLKFTIVNKPSWAAFSSNSGRLTGYPKSPGSWGNIQIRVSDGVNVATLPAFSITASVRSTTNVAPTISGSPIGSVNAGSAYSFRPTVSDPDSTTLAYSIVNRPSWATFDTTNGQLSGMPTASQVGSYGNITISVSDGRSTATLPAFSINVVDVSNGGAVLSWTPPTQNNDGSALTNLAGYRIVYGTSPSTMTQTVQVANAGITRYTMDNLSPGTYYFAVRAYTASGAESSNSNLFSKVVQ
ncbi:MAG TPA: putative Ig domain-containing protein [Steroidobacter sp.]|uniref:putative Ig domain-containing protein n=1 Tax=Steroidobacter sp. TaxID=1978227 RepID=UPI002ED846A7